MKYDWLKWFKEFLEEWRGQTGNALDADAKYEQRLMVEYLDQGISPKDAVTQELLDLS